MTDTDRIAQMAREAGFDTDDGEITAPGVMATGDPMDVTKQIEALIRIVIEQCAKVAEGYQDPCTGKAIADEIRANYSKEG